jgi:short/branched chain acyl-CoA dehydrogenase
MMAHRIRSSILCLRRQPQQRLFNGNGMFIFRAPSISNVNNANRRISHFQTSFSPNRKLFSTASRSTIELETETETETDDGASTIATRMPVTNLAEDELMIQDSVRSWANTTLRPLVREMEDLQQIPSSLLHQLFQNGCMGLEIPLHYHGGSGLNFTSACITVLELSRVDPSVALIVDIHNTLVVNAIRFWGSPFLKDKYLPRLATDTVSSFCLTEPDAGSDAFSMKSTATPSEDGSYYTIHGSKAWISSAREAGLLLVFCKVVDPNANKKKNKHPINSDSASYKTITAFLIDANAPGVHIGKPESKLGLKASSTCPITFDGVKVDADHILGEVGQGYKYCIQILNEGRIGIAAQQIGIAKGCLDAVFPYLHERTQFGQKLVDMPVMQQQYAQAVTELHAAEVMMYNTCRLKENGLEFVKESAMVKLYASQVADRIASQSVEWLGGIGYTTDLIVEKFYRDVKVGSIYEGSSNIQRQTIAKLVSKEYE